MKIINVAIGVFVILATSCDKRIPITPDALPKEWYVSQILESNDRDASIYAYNQFCFYYPDDIDFIPLTIYMIEQKHYGLACNYVYTEYTRLCEKYSIRLDSITKEYLLNYLQKGVEMKDTDCATDMALLYMKGEFVDRDTMMAKKYIMTFYPPKTAAIIWKYYIKKNPEFNPETNQ